MNEALVLAGDASGTALMHRGRALPCTIGRAGITRNKREGDGATPAGVLAIIGGLFRPDRIAAGTLPAWVRPMTPDMLWSDDPADADYNRLVRAPHAFGHERLWRDDGIYDLVLMTDWNAAPVVPGRGSAIFVHVWRGPGRATAGCVALARGVLIDLVRDIEPGARLIIS